MTQRFSKPMLSPKRERHVQVEFNFGTLKSFLENGFLLLVRG